MCVDDYQFRHLSTKKQKICRRFIFRSVQDHERGFLVNISQFQRFGQLCLCEILLHLSKKGLNIRDYSFYMPQFDINIEAGDKCRVPFDIMNTKEVIFEMKKIQVDQQSENYQVLYVQALGQQNFSAQQFIQNNQQCQQCMRKNGSTAYMPDLATLKGQNSQQNYESNMQQQQISQKPIIQYQNKNYGIKIKQIPNNVNNIYNNGQVKKHKQQQKTIEQALFKTKTWRMLHINCSFSLKNAANMVELSKKTLDDYFLVLRVGEYHGYNFKANLNKKIGHLRAFIRSQPIKVTGRLSKQVKSFSLIPEPDLSQILNNITQQKMQNIVQQQMGSTNKSDQQVKINESQMIPQ